MIAIAPDSSKTQFSYLRKCKPGDEHIASDYTPPRAKPRRWLSGLGALMSAGAIACSFWVAGLPSAVADAVGAFPKPPGYYEALEREHLWNTLGSNAYAAFEQQYQAEQRREALTQARADQQAAAQLKSEAKDIREQAEQYRLVASYEGADRISRYAEGEEIRATELVQVECRSEFGGWSAYLRSLDSGQEGKITNLASCNAGTVAAGGSVGTAGSERVSVHYR